jgi:DNA repair protein RecO (recombination protein O)
MKTSGRAELKRLNDWRYHGAVPLQQSAGLVQGLYVNELCVRLMPRFQADQAFFGVYASTLLLLARPAQQAGALRFFERRLLDASGFGVDYRQTMDNGDWIQADGHYRFDPAHGFCLGTPVDGLSGAQILAIAQNDWHLPGALALARHINTRRILHVLEGRTWHSQHWVS